VVYSVTYFGEQRALVGDFEDVFYSLNFEIWKET